MALSNSLQAYLDCKEFLEKALDDEVGARLPFRTSEQAEHWRMRCYQFRKLDREQNKAVFEIGHKMHGASEYDGLTMTIKESTDGWWWVYAKKNIVDAGSIEALSEIEEPTGLVGLISGEAQNES